MITSFLILLGEIMKNQILSIMDMHTIVSHYGIKANRDMCSCPFHKDKSPSMKIYDKSFYCFSCNRTGDIIQFVQYLFQLDFVKAMEKINYDFNLNLSKITDKQELKRIQLKYEQEKQRKEHEKQIYIKKMIVATNNYRIYSNLIRKYQNEMNEENWEDLQEAIIFLENKLELLNEYMEKIKKVGVS